MSVFVNNKRYRNARPDLTGRRIGRLLILRRALSAITAGGGRLPRWECRCICGTVVMRDDRQLKAQTPSCGCHARKYKRGQTKTREYKIWCGMIERCERPASKDFVNYGGRGIAVCQRWQDFQYFLKDMGSAPEGLTIERINTNGDYEPGNCCWASVLIQANNKRKSLRVMDGHRLLTIHELADELGVTRQAIYERTRGEHIKKYPLDGGPPIC